MAINPFQPFAPSSGGNAPVSANRADVTTKHPSLLDVEPQLRRIDHVLSGTDAVRSNARQYIPPDVGHIQNPDTYDAMISRTSFTNYTARCLDSLEGMIFRKDPDVSVPARYKPRLDNINGQGDSIHTFAKKAVRSVLSHARAVILVDSLPTDRQRFERPESLLPYLSLYSAFAVTNWRESEIDGQLLPDQVILREFYSEPQEFGSILRNRYRVLEIDEQGRYRVRLYDQRNETGEYYLSQELYPTTGSNDGQNFYRELPVVFITPLDLSMNIYRSPLLDLADANLHQFYLESIYSRSLHYTSAPTPVISGLREDTPSNFRFGGDSVILLPEGCTASMLEFQGHGLGPIERALAANKEHIAELGARLSQTKATGSETAEAARIRQHATTSVISSIARTVSDGIQKGLEIACKRAFADGKVSFELNQDYLDVQMSPQMLDAIGRANRDGLMTKRDAVYNMSRGELLQPGRSVEQVMGELETEKPNLVGMPDAAILLRQQQRNGTNAANGAGAPANGTTPPPQPQRGRQRARQTE